MQKTRYDKQIHKWVNATAKDSNYRELKQRIARKTQNAKQAKEIALEAQEMARKMKAESKRMIRKAKIQAILNLYYQSNKKIVEIAVLLGVEDSFVRDVLRDNTK